MVYYLPKRQRKFLHEIGPRLVSKSGVDLMKLFWDKFTRTFWKLDLFIDIHNIYCIGMKKSSLEKIVSKFTPKKVYEIDPWCSTEAE